MSPAISFSGEGLKRGAFWRQILSGGKTCTTRHARRRGRPEAGQIAYLYWKQRIPWKILPEGVEGYTITRAGDHDEWTKPIHKIGEAYILSVRRVASLKSLWLDEEYAYAEGFAGVDEMHRWWIPEIDEFPQGQLTLEMLPLVYRILDQMGPMDIIKWQHPLKEAATCCAI
jgi:hypothetical protein